MVGPELQREREREIECMCVCKSYKLEGTYRSEESEELECSSSCIELSNDTSEAVPVEEHAGDEI